MKARALSARDTSIMGVFLALRWTYNLTVLTAILVRQARGKV